VKTLPIPPAGESTHSRTNPPRRILVVDDDVSIRQLSLEVLTGFGYDVDTAEDGAAGWEALNGGAYDLLITDNKMPKLTGIDLLRKLRSARMVLPVIMVTGLAPAHEFAGSPWLIPDATLLKPFTVDELLGKVKAVLHINYSNAGSTEADPSEVVASRKAAYENK